MSPESRLPIDASERLSPRLLLNPTAAPHVAAQPLCEQRIGEPGSKGAPQTVAFGGHECAGQRCDHTSAGRELPEIIRQIADHLIIWGVAELFQHRGEVFLRQQLVRGPGRQAAPGEQQKPGGAEGRRP